MTGFNSSSERPFEARPRWSAYPSWRQFAWLYLISATVAWRGVLYWMVGLPGWEAWMGGAALLLALVVPLRYWARYEIAGGLALLRNGYTGSVMDAVPLDAIRRIELQQGQIAQWLGIGTMVFWAADKPALRFRGVADPDVVFDRLDRLRAVTGRSLSRAAA
jgi:hypothetical protein